LTAAAPLSAEGAIIIAIAGALFRLARVGHIDRGVSDEWH
jgi:hypothetical protein